MKTIPTLILSLFACASPAFSQADDPAATTDPLKSPMVVELRPLKSEKLGERFLKMMIAHHRAGIRMAELVGERGQNDELKEFAENSIGAQKKDITKMTGWLKEWYEGEADQEVLPEEMQVRSAKRMELLGSLRGNKFDHTFIPIMVDHHRGGIAAFELVGSRTEREPLRSFAEEAIKHQEKEIEKLESLIDEPTE